MKICYAIRSIVPFWLTVLLLVVAVAPVSAQTGACCTATSSTTFSCTPNVLSGTCANAPTETWVFNQGCPEACQSQAACCPAQGDCLVSNDTICNVINSGTFLPGQTCTGNPCANLPVELSSFDAMIEDGSIVLSWRTESEDGNWGFEIQSRLVDGNSEFETLGFEAGHGSTTQPRIYEYRVTEPSPGTHRLRLKQIDFDGAFAYSPEIEATVELPDRYYLETPYPNPFNPTATVQFGTAAQEEVSLVLYDATGRAVQQVYRGSTEPGQLVQVVLDAVGLPSGNYVLRLEGESSVSRVVTIAK